MNKMSTRITNTITCTGGAFILAHALTDILAWEGQASVLFITASVVAGAILSWRCNRP